MFDNRNESNGWGGFKNRDPYSAMEAGEVGSMDASAFADKAVRQGFIRKVFGAVSAETQIWLHVPGRSELSPVAGAGQ